MYVYICIYIYIYIYMGALIVRLAVWGKFYYTCGGTRH